MRIFVARVDRVIRRNAIDHRARTVACGVVGVLQILVGDLSGVVRGKDGVRELTGDVVSVGPFALECRLGGAQA